MPSPRLEAFKIDLQETNSLVFRASYRSLADIANTVQQICTEAGLDSFQSYQVETSVDEAVTNIIDYSYGGEDRGDITFEWQILPDGVMLTLRDYGQPFDPNCIPIPNVDGTLDEREACGLGLYIIRQWMDEVHFDFQPGMNILTMVKHKPAQG